MLSPRKGHLPEDGNASPEKERAEGHRGKAADDLEAVTLRTPCYILFYISLKLLDFNIEHFLPEKTE